MAITFNSNKTDNEIKEEQQKAQPDAPNKSDNGTENSGNQPEIKEEQQKAVSGTAVVKYIGTGIWLDQYNEKWGQNDIKGTNIKNVRQYPLYEYEKREDLKFMVSYGAMEVNIVEG